MVRRRHRSRQRKDGKVRRHVAGLMRDYRGIFRQAGYRVIGRQITTSGVSGSKSLLDAYEGARIVGVRVKSDGTPRLILTWGLPRSGPASVKIAVTHEDDRD